MDEDVTCFHVASSHAHASELMIHDISQRVVQFTVREKTSFDLHLVALPASGSWHWRRRGAKATLKLDMDLDTSCRNQIFSASR